MKTRCPYVNCLAEFELGDEREFATVKCICCGKTMTARTVARHQEIDKQVEKHKQQGSHFLTSKLVLSKSSSKMVAVIEEVRSLWNVGSIFRSADGAGFTHLHLVGITGCPPRKEITKTSLGAEDHVSWSYTGSSLEPLQALKDEGFYIVGLERNEQSVSLQEALLNNLIKDPVCLVVGNEVSGLYAETLSICNVVCHLPMHGFKESLNVAVAFGIAAYAISERIISSPR